MGAEPLSQGNRYLKSRNQFFMLALLGALLWETIGCLAYIQAAEKQTCKTGGATMLQRAGTASFSLPEMWIDNSMYTYYSPDKLFKLTLFFDDAIDEPTAEAMLRDRLAKAQVILPDFKIVGPPAPIQIAGQDGRVVTFDSRDAGGVTRSRLLVLLWGPRRGLVITAQGAADKWPAFESAWEAFVSSFTLEWL